MNNAYRDAAQRANFYSGVIMPVAGNLMNISYALTAALGGLLSVLQGFQPWLASRAGSGTASGSVISVRASPSPTKTGSG